MNSFEKRILILFLLLPSFLVVNGYTHALDGYPRKVFQYCSKFTTIWFVAIPNSRFESIDLLQFFI